MTEPIDPGVRAALHRITDRFLRLGQSTQKHDIRAKLDKAQRLALDALERERFLHSGGDVYLPTLKALEFEEAGVAGLVREYTQVVLARLRDLSLAKGPKEFLAGEVAATIGSGSPGDAGSEIARIGLWFAIEFHEYISGWRASNQGTPITVIVKEEIYDFETFDAAWKEELQWRSAQSVPAVADDSLQSVEEPMQGDPLTKVAGHYGKWDILSELGRGGQGVVYLARDTSQFDIERVSQALISSVRRLVEPTQPAERDAATRAGEVAERILQFAERESPKYLGALKVLHETKDAQNLAKRLERMKSEIRALQELAHPNIIRILDANLDQRWFVTEYFPERSLAEPKHRNKYEGRLLDALVAFRPLVAGVAELHARKVVHRDIKPENIFVSPDRGLVLGDFGLVFFADEEHTRVSETLENVGSRDWMPAWAMGMRVEDLKPAFDVFSLGKILWSIVAGKAKLRLWYIHEPEFELENMFPDDADMHWANTVLEKSVVEKETKCLPDAGALLDLIDSAVRKLRPGSAPLSPSVGIRCRFCGVGTYIRGEVYANGTSPCWVGLMPQERGSRSDKGRAAVMRCSHCGHLEWFQLDGVENSHWWDK